MGRIEMLHNAAMMDARELERSPRALWVIRALVVVAMFGYLLFGALLRMQDPNIVDPWSMRLAVSVAMLAHLVATFTAVGKRNLPWLNFFAVVVMDVHALALLAVSNAAYASMYAFVLLFSMQVGVLPLVYPDLKRKVIGAAVIAVGVVVVALTVQEPETNIGIVVYSGFLMAAIFFVGHVAQRLQDRVKERWSVRLQTALAHSEAVLFTLDHQGRLSRVEGSKVSRLGLPDDASVKTIGRVAAVSFPKLADLIPRALAGNSAEDFIERDGRTFHFVLHPLPPGHDDRVVGIVTDVTRTKRVEAELRAARQSALEASLAKSRFVANMSHELRTPLNGVIGMAHLLETTRLSREQREYVHGLTRSGTILLDLINEILDFSKIEAGEMTVEAVPVDLRQLTADVVGVLASKASTKGLYLVAEVGPDVPRRVLTDPVRMRQILLNLLGNAVKFTERGEVVVAIDFNEGDHLHVAVRDTGIGMHADQLARLFDPFTQADGSTTRRFGGTGLGLAITKQLVELLGGVIEVESAPGEGSQFSATIPCSAAPSAEIAPWLDGVAVEVQHRHTPTLRMLERTVTGWGGTLVPPGSGATLRLIERALFDGNSSQPTVLLLASDDRLTMPDVEGVAWLRAPYHEPGLAEAVSGLLQGPNPEVEAPRVQARAVEVHVLLVEDNPVNQLVASRLLEKQGHRVTTAGNGSEALDRLSDHRFDLVLMDCQMPVMDGFEATRAIRELPIPTCRVPIVALTANALSEDRQRCLDCGMDDYLAKPLDPEALASVIRSVASRAA